MRVLVTGGSGHLGMQVVTELAELGHDPWILDVMPPPDEGWRGRWKHVDVSLGFGAERDDAKSAASTIEELARHVPTAVVHLAGLLGTHELWERSATALTVNTVGTAHILEACRQTQARYVGVMTGNPWKNPYTISKRAAAELAEGYALWRGVSTSTLRVFNVYGPGPSLESKVVPQFVEAALAGRALPLIGTGDQSLDLVHVSVVAQALISAALRPDVIGTIDVGSGRARSVRAFGNDIVQLTQPSSSTFTFERMPERRGEGPEHPIADVTRMEQDLDVTASDADDEVYTARLEETVQWYRERLASGVG